MKSIKVSIDFKNLAGTNCTMGVHYVPYLDQSHLKFRWEYIDETSEDCQYMVINDDLVARVHMMYPKTTMINLERLYHGYVKSSSREEELLYIEQINTIVEAAEKRGRKLLVNLV
jgi:hypothetical protein